MEFNKTEYSNLSSFLQYIAAISETGEDRIPPLSDLSRILGISVATLREQLEIARIMGFVEVKPKAGIRKTPYSFKPAVATSLTYALASEAAPFEQYASLRKHLEAAYFLEAVKSLTPEDKSDLEGIVVRAEEKLRRAPAVIPTSEHREFHLLIYKRINNPFMLGLLEAYWDLYKAVGFEIYPDMAYVSNIWQYHRKMVELINARNYDQAYQSLLEHMELIALREKKIPRQSFE
jgi:DNA-binding FadR family transcriptional regulator